MNIAGGFYALGWALALASCAGFIVGGVQWLTTTQGTPYNRTMRYLTTVGFIGMLVGAFVIGLLTVPEAKS